MAYDSEAERAAARQKALDELIDLKVKHPAAFEGLVKWWVFAGNLGVLGVGIKNVLIVIGVIIGAWLALKGWIGTEILGNGPRP